MLLTDEHIWYIRGYEDNTIRPEHSISRAEVAMVFFRLLKSEHQKIPQSDSRYIDVQGDEWFGLAINTLAYHGILEGYEGGSFRPNNPITRREIAAVVSRFEQLIETNENPFNDVNFNDWAYKYILSAAKKGWFIGDDNGNFRAGDNVTRAEFVTVANRVMNRHILLEDIPKDVHKFNDFAVTHWSYTNFIEAVYTHAYNRKADGKNEIWTAITGHGLNAAYNQ